MKYKLLPFLFSYLLFWSNLLAQDQPTPLLSVSSGEYNGAMLLEQLVEQGIPLAYSIDKLPKTSCFLKKGLYSPQQIFDWLEKCSGIQTSFESGIYLVKYAPPKKFTVRGVVKDKSTGEALIGATILLDELNSGVVTNIYGHYTITLPQGDYIFFLAYLGYETIRDTLLVSGNQKVDFELAPKSNELNAVTISGMDPTLNVSSMLTGFNTINLNTKGEIPFFLGEVDVLQGATLLPGIKKLGEDANGLNVRGGGTDQNLILLDNAVIYNPNHLFGLISVFNPEAVNHVEIMKGYIPPAYGGRASAIISVIQKDGNNQQHQFTGGIGLVSARFIAEGPLIKQKSSYILSARQSLLDLDFDNINTKTNFQDMNLKLHYQANSRNNFYVSGYFGNDQNKNIFDRVSNWGNRNISGKWNHFFANNLIANWALSVSEYSYRVSQPQEAASFIGKSRIIDYDLKADLSYSFSPNHQIDFGGEMIFHRLKPGDRIPFEDNSSSSNPLFLDSEHGIESALYFSHVAKFTPRLSANYGLRISALNNIGPGERYVYRDDVSMNDASITDTLSYGRFESMAAYLGWEPRISINYSLNSKSSIKASYSRTNQYLHLISNTVTPSPTDIWKLSDAHIKPLTTDQFSLGLYRNFKDNNWESYIEGYYKEMNNLLDYKNGADLLYNENVETELIAGNGRSYGLEFFLKRNAGTVSGWLSYTLSRTENQLNGQFPEEIINGGAYFPVNHDKTHALSLVTVFELTPQLSSSLSFNYNSGRPYTQTVGKYQFEGITVPHFGDRNQGRLPDYHRLDLSIKWRSKPNKKNGSPRKLSDYWTFILYNVYGRNNVQGYVLDKDETTGATTVIPYTVFDQIIPAITYHFKF